MLNLLEHSFQSTLFIEKNFNSIINKTAELSQKRPRDAPNIWVP